MNRREGNRAGGIARQALFKTPEERAAHMTMMRAARGQPKPPKPDTVRPGQAYQVTSQTLRRFSCDVVGEEKKMANQSPTGAGKRNPRGGASVLRNKSERLKKINQEIGIRLRLIREHRKMSTSEAGVLLKIGESGKTVLYPRETATVTIEACFLAEMARLYKVSADWLLGLSDDMRGHNPDVKDAAKLQATMTERGAAKPPQPETAIRQMAQEAQAAAAQSNGPMLPQGYVPYAPGLPSWQAPAPQKPTMRIPLATMRQMNQMELATLSGQYQLEIV